jgi:hypothetical protein
MAKADILFI